MKEIDKLRILIPHWIEHNEGHEADCKKWSDIAKVEGLDKVAIHIDAAVIKMAEVNTLLEKALAEAGGPAEHSHDHHGHHHHHHHDD